jgi:uncharacterized protein (DUF433 family)
MKNYRYVSSQTLLLSGTNIPVRRLWEWYTRGTSVETLIKRYPQLGPAKILSALAFCYDNLSEIEADIAWAKHEEIEARSDIRQLKIPGGFGGGLF